MFCVEIMRYDRRSKNELTTVRHIFYKNIISARRCQKRYLDSKNCIYAVVHTGVDKSYLSKYKIFPEDTISYNDYLRRYFNEC